ncbi:hypothetical protein [Microbacterium esteraromaticum]|nr:hypothetical protein [Microbacterium esteraromaticum]
MTKTGADAMASGAGVARGDPEVAGRTLSRAGGVRASRGVG